MPSPTDAPASLPERLADAEGELPTRLRIIADGDLRTMARDSLVGIHPDQHELHEWADLMDEAADALTAAESAREEAEKQRDRARRGKEEDIAILREVAAENEQLRAANMRLQEIVAADDAKAIAEYEWERANLLAGGRDKAATARDAALARAERAEKALQPFAEAADNLEVLAKQDGSPPAVYKAVFWHSTLVAARAALAHPATAEET